MVTAPETKPGSPAAAVSWQQSCQPGCDQPSGPRPAVNPFVSLARVWVTTPASCCRQPNH